MSLAHLGVCPGCDSTGEIGVACSEKACTKLGYHFIPEAYWAELGDEVGDPIVGQTIGDFLVVAAIGSGGFGRVYLALQAPLYRLKGALKLLELPSQNAVVVDAMLDKFRQEAEALAELAHPNIVRLIKYGIHNERPYLVMEYIDKGRTLREEIWQRATAGASFSHTELLDILGQVLNGLDAAHERNIIHRDIKPENIMIQPVAGHPNHLKILDFGTAKFTEEHADTKWPLGSPSYMAPEQIEMKGIGPWSDLFAVGVLTFELLSGRKPFPGEDENSIITKKLDLDYDPMVQLVGLDFPEVTERFLQRALSIDTEARFQSVAEYRAGLADAVAASEQSSVVDAGGVELTSLLDSSDLAEMETVGASDVPARTGEGKPPSLPEEERSPMRRIGVLLLVLAVSGGAVWAYSQWQKRLPDEQAERPVAPETTGPVVQEEPEGVDAGPDMRGEAVTAAAGLAQRTATAAVTVAEAEPPRRIAAVTAGKFHSCVARRDGKVRCWGANFDGELGLGHEETIGDDEPLSDAPWIDFDDPVVELESAGDRGSSFNCARSISGKVRCWGSNSFGQLGLGHTMSIGSRNRVGGPGHGAVQLGGLAIEIAVGGAEYASHACAIIEGGAVRCWGGNNFGQLGLGHTRSIGDNERPESVAPVELGGPATAIAAGKYHTCALLEDATVRCWGFNREGQLGYGHTDNIGDDETPASAGPVPIGFDVASIATGRFHTCAVSTGGKLRCWGWNKAGQLGYPDSDNIGDDEPASAGGDIAVGGLVDHVITGSLHTCALLQDGKVKCWGDNKFGQLGYGHETAVKNPAMVGQVFLGGAVAELYAGSYHNCAVLKSDELRCWGFNKFGQLGLGHTRDIGDDEPPASVPVAPVFEEER